MKPTTEKLLNELRQLPEYEAEGLALELIGQCELRRAQLGLSYAELARRMGVSRTYISKLMSGTQNSTLGSLVKLARALECEMTIGINYHQPLSDTSKHRMPAARKGMISIIPSSRRTATSRPSEGRTVRVAAHPAAEPAPRG